MTERTGFTFDSAAGQKLGGYCWMKEGQHLGVVQLVHGMAEHIERYDRIARALAEAGYIVVGHTHAGHGECPRKGWFAKKNGWQCLIDDVHTLRLRTQKRFPGLPYILLGHSMGSFVVRCYLMAHAEGLRAAVLSGTGHYDKALLIAAKTLANVVCLCGGAEKPSALINSVAFGASNKPFEPARTPFDWLSRDEAEVDKYVADPDCGFLFTGSGYRDMFRGLDRLTDHGALRRMPAELPVLFLSGAKDPIGGMGKGVETVAQEFRTAGLRDVTVKLYPDGRHEMFNELNHGQVAAELAEWLTEKVNAS